jgi:adenosylcobinamide-GDP ribazoletransferase
MKKEVRIFLTAIMFLTRIRVPPTVDHSPDYLQAAPRYFPVVGWIVGAISALFYLVAARFISVDAGVMAAMIAGLLVTGAFHEDGFADVCDGFGGGWTKEKILEIMKDSRIGAYGAIGLIVLLGSKFILLKELPAFTPSLEPAGFALASAGSGLAAAAHGSSHWFSGAPWNVFYDHRYIILAILCAHSLSRLMPVLVMQTATYARAGIADLGKSGAITGKRLSVPGLIAGIVFALAPFAFLSWHFLLVIVPVLYATFELNRYFKRWIGGYTGDSLGTIQQVSEILVYLGFVLIFRYF